jgi:hypothetical protein
MLTGKRRKYLEERNSSDKGKKAEYDYRVLKWLETMLDPGKEGGIGDVNRVLDTLDHDSIRKYLKDENIYNLLKLVLKLMDYLDFLPVEQSTRGQAIVIKPQGYQNSIRIANENDYRRNLKLYNFAKQLKRHYSDPSEVKQLEGMATIEKTQLAGQDIEKIKATYNLENEPGENRDIFPSLIHVKDRGWLTETPDGNTKPVVTPPPELMRFLEQPKEAKGKREKRQPKGE